MSISGDANEPLQPPPVISTMLAPMRPQIVERGLDHQSVLNSVKRQLAVEQVPANPDTSAISDPTVALADAWAVASDVLGFYQERLINESYIGTAVEDRSIFELARMVGYTPDWGLAASCYLYYTIDETVLRDVRIPARSKIRAIPQPGEEPQTFETSKDLIARSRWNAIRAATSEDFPVNPATPTFYFRGTATGLKPGDLFRTTQVVRDIYFPDQKIDIDIYFLVQKVDVDRETDQTVASVVLRYGPNGTQVPDKLIEIEARDTSIPSPPTEGTDAYYQIQMKGQPWIEENALTALKPASTPDPENEPVKIVGFRKLAMVFGHNAPRRPKNPPDLASDIPWVLDNADRDQTDVIDLEGHHPSIVRNSRLCIEIPNRSVHGEDLEFYNVLAAQLTSRTGYGMTGDITRITLDRRWKSAPREKTLETYETYEGVVQGVIVHVDDVDLHLGKKPIECIGAARSEPPTRNPQTYRQYRQPTTSQLAKKDTANAMMGQQTQPRNAIELDGIYPGIKPGRLVILSGDPPKNVARAEDQEPELLKVSSVSHPRYPFGEVPKEAAHETGKPNRTTLTFEEVIKYTYDPKTVKIYGNVVEATHGESYTEVLGSGIGSREHQSFGLTRSPLTRLPVPTFPGARPELSVMVEEEEWTCVDTLARSREGERVFSLWTDDTSVARVYFGNGRAGARLPTGRENVKANYRIGLGRSGNIGSERLKLPVDHPLGVQQVSNTRASGGSDREPLSLIRSNTPLSTVALDRLVSQADFLHMARVYPGIAKAKVRYASIRAHDIVVVSILSDGVMPMKADSAPCKALQAAMASHQDATASIFVVPGVLRPISVAATVKLRPGASWDDTEAKVRAALLNVFGFERQELAQRAFASEALAAIQSVKAVEFATLTEFQRYDANPVKPKHLQSCIEACNADFDTNGNLTGAELLLIQPHIPSSVTLEQDKS
jgi:hypothetical protein